MVDKVVQPRQHGRMRRCCDLREELNGLPRWSWLRGTFSVNYSGEWETSERSMAAI